MAKKKNGEHMERAVERKEKRKMNKQSETDGKESRNR